MEVNFRRSFQFQLKKDPKHMTEELAVGNIVKVTNPANIHHRMQAQVVGFNEGDKETPVRIWFGREADHLIMYHDRVNLTKTWSLEAPPESEQAGDFRVWDYAEKDLTICSGWTVKTLAERYYPRHFHSCYEAPEPFVAGAHVCDIEGCANPTTKRIVFNIQGTVFPADVCDTCAPKYHGKCGDTFPMKERDAA